MPCSLWPWGWLRTTIFLSFCLGLLNSWDYNPCSFFFKLFSCSQCWEPLKPIKPQLQLFPSLPLGILGVELGALHWLNRHSATWATWFLGPTMKVLDHTSSSISHQFCICTPHPSLTWLPVVSRPIVIFCLWPFYRLCVCLKYFYCLGKQLLIKTKLPYTLSFRGFPDGSFSSLC
jgi:hypothetical protein